MMSFFQLAKLLALLSLRALYCLIPYLKENFFSDQFNFQFFFLIPRDIHDSILIFSPSLSSLLRSSMIHHYLLPRLPFYPSPLSFSLYIQFYSFRFLLYTIKPYGRHSLPHFTTNHHTTLFLSFSLKVNFLTSDSANEVVGPTKACISILIY